MYSPGTQNCSPGAENCSPCTKICSPGTQICSQGTQHGRTDSANGSQNHFLAARIDSRSSQMLLGAPRSSEKLEKSISVGFKEPERGWGRSTGVTRRWRVNPCSPPQKAIFQDQNHKPSTINSRPLSHAVAQSAVADNTDIDIYL